MNIRKILLSGLLILAISPRPMLAGDCGTIIHPKGEDFKHGAYWIEKGTCERHYSNIIPVSKAYSYGVYKGSWDKINKVSFRDKEYRKKAYADTKTTIKVSNKCYFIQKFDGKAGLKKNEVRKVGDRTVELHIGEYSYKGDENSFGNDYDPREIKSNATSWNFFNSPLNCSEVPQREEWTVRQKVNGKWQVTAKQKFILNP